MFKHTSFRSKLAPIPPCSHSWVPLCFGPIRCSWNSRCCSCNSAPSLASKCDLTLLFTPPSPQALPKIKTPRDSSSPIASQLCGLSKDKWLLWHNGKIPHHFNYNKSCWSKSWHIIVIGLHWFYCQYSLCYSCFIVGFDPEPFRHLSCYDSHQFIPVKAKSKQKQGVV